MKILIQRVKTASVKVDNKIVGNIDKGILLFIGIHKDDTREQVDFLVDKTINLRIFPDEHGVMNRSVKDISGEILAISQFTLYGDCKKGRRPSYSKAANSTIGEPLYDYFVEKLKNNIPTKSGIFGANMDISLINDGPVTLILEK